jgi:drug/metabolite transporter (DMT)-like permease
VWSHGNVRQVRTVGKPDPVTVCFRPVPRLSAFVGLHVAVALFGLAGLFGKWLTLPPFAIVAGRAGIAAIALGAVLALQRKSFRVRPALALNGVVLAVHWVTFFEAIRASTVAIGLLGYATFPLFVILLERFMLGRALRAERIATGMLVVAGLVVLVPSYRVEDSTVQGLGWGLVSGFTFALLAVRSRGFAGAYAPIQIAFWQNAVAAAVLLPLAWLGRDALAALTLHEAALMTVLGIVCTALAHTLFISSLHRVTAHTASVVAALEPVYGIVLAAWLLGEVPGPRTLAGAGLIVAAAIVATRGERTEAV